MIQDVLREGVSLGETVEVPSDETINHMLARGDDEFELFMKMDKEMDAQHQKGAAYVPLVCSRFVLCFLSPHFSGLFPFVSCAEWREQGNRGRYQRLMSEEELPDFVTRKVEVAPEKPLGKGARVRGTIAYNDSLTEREFQDVVESGYETHLLSRLEKGIVYAAQQLFLTVVL